MMRPRSRGSSAAVVAGGSNGAARFRVSTLRKGASVATTGATARPSNVHFPLLPLPLLTSPTCYAALARSGFSVAACAAPLPLLSVISAARLVASSAAATSAA
jgi:hypothetical protein